MGPCLSSDNLNARVDAVTHSQLVVSHHPKVVRSSFFWLYTLRGSILNLFHLGASRWIFAFSARGVQPGRTLCKEGQNRFSFGLAAWDLWGAHCFAQNCSMGRGKGNQALQCGVVCKNRFPCAILRLQYPRPSRCRWGTTPAPAQMWILLNIKTCPLRRAAGR